MAGRGDIEFTYSLIDKLFRLSIGESADFSGANGVVSLGLSLIPRYIASPDFRLAFMSGVSANTICFERKLFEHYRIVFERV